MSQWIDSGYKSFVCGAAIAQYLRVKLDGAEVIVAGDEPSIGTLRDASFADGDVRAVALKNKPGTQKMVAGGVIAAGALVYSAAAGKVAAAGAALEGYALHAASADNDVIEVLPLFTQDGADPPA